MSLSKVKLSITLDSELVKWLDQKIKKKQFANRSHGLEYAVSQLKEKE
ncbi:MAG: ribbon-helix-helix domain-containing protein [Nitrosopumilus sp.]|jgi:Arc/MetJ-type ribon-helix-helix transcriptional regulator|nr:ribbon-helix-helix domain-containing protein [Nitrosopumilus sp.]MCV0366339.1 ribbon-helix-helix domain-containing protein [Nitrosopumilus sp.]